MMGRRTVRRKLLKAGFLLVVAAAVVLLLEVSAHMFVTYALGGRHVVEPHPVVGWTTRAGLNITRRNSEGEFWNIRTAACGMRGPCDWPANAGRRLLIVGDSFAFGEGVALERRFDSELVRADPRWSGVNVGVMGFGTDQQILAARPFVARLDRTDVVLWLVHGTDFSDILRKRFVGRAKPWFERAGAGAVEHPPAFTWFDFLRHRSYVAALAAVAAARFEAEYPAEDMEEAILLLEAMVSREADRWRQKGLQIVLARHGMNLVTGGRGAAVQRRLGTMWGVLCDRGPYCTDLDSVLSDEGSFLADGHWNARGHQAVARRLQQVLAALG